MNVAEALAAVGMNSSPILGVFDQMGWAEDEIVKAMERHDERFVDGDGRNNGPIWSAFRLLTPTHERMREEWIYRPHCRELLERVARGVDTRPGTDVEVAFAMMEVSLATPIHGAACGLQFRMFKRLWPDRYESVFADGAADADDYEKMYGPQIDEHEDFTRKKLRQDWRR